jgi:hypothetical protein
MCSLDEPRAVPYVVRGSSRGAVQYRVRGGTPEMMDHGRTNEPNRPSASPVGRGSSRVIATPDCSPAGVRYRTDR